MFGSSSHVHFGSLLFVLTVVCTVQATDDVEYTVPLVDNDTLGGELFMEEMVVDYAKELMSSITHGIWEFIFWQNIDIRVKVRKISLYIDKTTVLSSSKRITSHAYEIHLGGVHIGRCRDYMEQEIYMLLCYEIAHILQNTGNGQIPPALFDGIATYVVIRLSKKPKIFVQCTNESIWDQDPPVFGQFLDYCANKYTAFVETLNKKMVASYNDNYFVEISDKTIEELWKEYKSKHDIRV